jgi:hypothetical protein
MGIYYIRDFINNENITDIKQILEEIKKYNTLYQDICKAPIGKYSINTILETVEESLNYLEIYAPVIKLWADEYLEKNRGILWLYYGIEKGTYLTEYWKQSETKIGELKSMWPFIFNRDNTSYKGFIIDLEEAQNEVLRQRKRQDTSNPNYVPFHPDGCPSRCSCWMLDDMEQWFEEELKEKKESRNIFFNSSLQKDFYPIAIQDIELLKEQWNSWTPIKQPTKTFNNEIKITIGQTPINLVLSWMKDDFNYSVFSMFDWSDTFENVWNQIDSVQNFIHSQRQKLKKILELI